MPLPPDKRNHQAEYARRVQPTDESDHEIQQQSDQLLEAAAKRGGRPSTYSAEIAIEIIGRVAEGETVAGICKDDHMPSKMAVYWWTRRYPRFGMALNHARTLQGEAWGEAAVSTVDQDPYAGLDKKDKDSHSIAKVRTMHQRVKGDVLLRAAGRRDPERWGDRPNAAAGVQVVINTNLNIDQPLTAGRLVASAKGEI